MKKRIWKKVIAITLLGAISVSMLGCSRQTTGSNDTKSEYKYGKIDIPGKDGSLCGAPIYIAYEKGFFAEEGFDVNLISADTENVISAMIMILRSILA